MAREIRGDIQGLRAVAVAVVICAHAGVTALPGGFVGVDVFFVISGYLISGLLFREVLVTGGVSIGQFWARRARRILPAATVVSVVTVVASLLIMGLLDAREVVVDAIWASAFAANIHFAQEGVYYFAQDTGPSPMQHYWSLAVEEQFYLVWPVLLFGIILLTRLLTGRNPRRLPRGAVLVVLLAVVVASLAWSIHQTVAAPTTAYFSTLTRAWELGIGALVALIPASAVARLHSRYLQLMAFVGAVVVVGSCVVITSATPFPGIAAALPVGGTALLLIAGHGGARTLVGELLSTEPFRVIGDWSYSLYLWHWPVLVLPEYALGRGLNAFESGLAVLVTLTLSAYSYQYVEMPFRNGGPAHRLPRRRALVLYPASAVLVLGVGGLAWLWTGAQADTDGDNPPITIAGSAKPGAVHVDTVALVRASVNAARERQAIPSKTDPSILELRESVADVGECDYEQNVRKLCQVGEENGDKTVVLIGDSHARAWIPAFDRINEAGNWKAYYLVKPQCTAAHIPIASAQSDDTVFTDCSDFQDWVIEQVEDLNPDLVVVASSPPVNGVFDGDKRVTSVDDTIPLLRAGYDELFRELDAAADEVVLLRDVPKSPEDPATCLTTGDPSLGDCMFEPDERSQILGNVAVDSANVSGARVVDPTPWLCYQGECPIVIGGTLSYRDTDHITTEYAANLWATLGRALRMIPTNGVAAPADPDDAVAGGSTD
ncbi:acyltransferase family protein [Nocardioides sp.]|uniref:acyltransferase family protein n=1 Tax=Nocardioides sp. TaxID=35761 RepID=UPI001A31578F|nr:acyltransferase family protein [Nocardioides sp.]MBJ7359344.1 acyltransferase [Nocardioides sp.]